MRRTHVVKDAMRLDHGQSARRRAGPVTLNCGYSHGFSVLDVIDMVRRVSGVDFRVDFAAKRPGDPAQIVAKSARIRQTLGWRPQFDDLATIVAHALAWERRLQG
jgi:UDP-glucose 4-epimerase